MFLVGESGTRGGGVKVETMRLFSTEQELIDCLELELYKEPWNEYTDWKTKT